MYTAVPRLKDDLVAANVSTRDFDALYEQHFSFVWRNLRRLGVPELLIEDATQDTFVVVHRKLADLRPDASAKGWLFGIASRVASDYRRRLKRKPAVNLDADTQESSDRGPFERTAAEQAWGLLERFLNTLDEDRRVVFVMAELEDMGAPEISQAVGARLNTVYSRLRSARERFVSFLEAEGNPHG